MQGPLPSCKYEGGGWNLESKYFMKNAEG